MTNLSYSFNKKGHINKCITFYIKNLLSLFSSSKYSINNTYTYVIIDTNVFVSAFITNDASSPTIKILDLFYDDKINLYYSDDIISEYKNVLSRYELVMSCILPTKIPCKCRAVWLNSFIICIYLNFLSILS